MLLFVTTSAKSDQVVRHVPAKLVPGLYVMNLQILYGTAVLAPPAISFQNLVSDHRVFFRVQFESWLLLA
jgi:hypothetical protein